MRATTLHNGLFVQDDCPVSKNWNPKHRLFKSFFLNSFSVKTLKLVCFFPALETSFFVLLKIGKNDLEIANLEFESHGFLENHVCLPTGQAETNICLMVYQDINFRICLSLFTWKELKLHKEHIVHCTSDDGCDVQSRKLQCQKSNFSAQMKKQKVILRRLKYLLQILS